MARQNRVYSRPKQPRKPQQPKQPKQSIPSNSTPSSTQLAPKKLYLSHLKNDRIQCPQCQQLNIYRTLTGYSGYSSLYNHYKRKHPECSVPQQIENKKNDKVDIHGKSKKGRPKENSEKKKKTQEKQKKKNTDWKIRQKNTQFIADILMLFYDAVQRLGKHQKISQPMETNEQDFYKTKLQPQKMIQIIGQVQKTLQDKWQYKPTAKFVALCLSLAKYFLKKIKENEYPSDKLPLQPPVDPANDWQLLEFLDRFDYNDLEELIEYEQENSIFSGMEEWEELSAKFNENFLSRMKKDLLAMVWLSGLIGKNFFVEYVYLVCHLMEKESGLQKYQNETIKFDGFMIEEDEESLWMGFVEDGWGFKLLGLEHRLQLVNLREEFLKTE